MIAELTKRSSDLHEITTKKESDIDLTKKKIVMLREQLQAAEKILAVNELSLANFKTEKRNIDIKLTTMQYQKKIQQAQLQKVLSTPIAAPVSKLVVPANTSIFAKNPTVSIENVKTQSTAQLKSIQAVSPIPPQSQPPLPSQSPQTKPSSQPPPLPPPPPPQSPQTKPPLPVTIPVSKSPQVPQTQPTASPVSTPIAQNDLTLPNIIESSKVSHEPVATNIQNKDYSSQATSSQKSNSKYKLTSPVMNRIDRSMTLGSEVAATALTISNSKQHQLQSKTTTIHTQINPKMTRPNLFTSKQTSTKLEQIGKQQQNNMTVSNSHYDNR